jgi:hypothetical protein
LRFGKHSDFRFGLGLRFRFFFLDRSLESQRAG